MSEQDINEQRIDALWDIIKRYDFYIGTSNVKSGLLITFNTAIVGAVLLKADTVLPGVAAGWPTVAARWLLVLITVASLLSLLCVVISIDPRVGSASTRKDSDYQSVIFFGSVTKNFDAGSYRKYMSEVPLEELRNDLARQAWELASIVTAKFALLRWAVRSVVWALLPLMATLAAIVVWT